MITIAGVESRPDGQSIRYTGTVYHTFSFEWIPGEPTDTLASVANDGTCGIFSLKTGQVDACIGLVTPCLVTVAGARGRTRSFATINQNIDNFDLLPYIADQLGTQTVTTSII